MKASRWIAGLGIGALLALSLALGLASAWIGSEAIARAAADRAASRLGCPVAFAAADVRWLPRPALRLREVRVCEERDPLSLVAGAVELRPSLPALLAGRVSADTGLAVHDGVARIGPRRLENLELRGSLGGERASQLVFAADLPGGGTLRDGRLDLHEAGDAARAWSATARLDVDLARVDALRALGLAASEGVGQGTLALGGAGRSLASAELVMTLHHLQLRDENGLAVRGSVDLEARLGEGFRLDLGAADLSLGASLRKPPGVYARAAGLLPQACSGGDCELELRELQVGRSRLRGELRLHAGRASAEVSGEIDLADLADASGWAGLREGRLHLERLAWVPPLPLHGAGRVERARVELGERARQLSLSGPVSLLGSRLSMRRAVAELLGAPFHGAGSYDLVTGEWEAEAVSREGVEIADLAGSVETGPFRTGRAYGRVVLRGGREPASLRGDGELEVFDGTADHLSLQRVTPEGIGPGSGPHAFERLSGRFAIRDRQIEFTELALEQDGERAQVSGSVSLDDGGVDLAGGAEYVLGDTPVVTPIELSGTLDRLDARVEDPPEARAERREAERVMLEAMRVQLREGPVPDDPVRAAALREHLQRIEERLRRVEAEGDV